MTNVALRRCYSAADVSIVVIGRNEGDRLRRCLESIAALPDVSTPREVIYVDSGSTDDSFSLAERMGAQLIALRPERPTAAIGRNAGWRVASGAIVFFLDGDTELAAEFLPKALACFDDPNMAVVWGHRRELHPERSVYNRVMDLDWIYPAGPAEFCGGDALFRRDYLQRMGGYDESLIAGEEPELCRRIIADGGKVLHIDSLMTMHDLAITRFRQYWLRARRAGHAYAEVSQRFANTAEPFWSAVAKRNRWHASVLLATVGVAVACGLIMASIWPLLVWLVLFGVVVLRTAWRARWKSPSWFTLVSYAIHSHFQHVPIFVGQLRFFLGRRRGVRERLVEYKER